MFRVAVFLSLVVASLACTANTDCGSADNTQPGLCVNGVCQCGFGYAGNQLRAPTSCTAQCTPATIPDAFTNLNEPTVTVTASGGNFVLGVNSQPWLQQNPSTVALLHPVNGASCSLMTGAIGSWDQAIVGVCNSSLTYASPFATQVSQPCVTQLADTQNSDGTYSVTFSNYQTRVQVDQTGQGPLATGQKRQFTTPIASTFQRDYTISIGTTFTVASQTFAVLAANIVTPTAPNAVDDAISTNENAAVINFNWKSNDVAGTYQIVSATPSAPSHGTVSAFNLASGTLTYTPNANYYGVDSFTYTVCDNGQPSAAYCASFPTVPSCTTPAAPLCDTATITVTINPTGPVANPDTANCAANSNVNVNVLANDATPITPVAVTITAQPSAGGSAAVQSDNSITFTASAQYAGPSVFTYQVCDPSSPAPLCSSATVTITVQSTAPTAQDDSATVEQDSSNNSISVLSNDAAGSSPLNIASLSITVAPAHGSASVASGAISYSPAAGYHGADSLTYQICDIRTPTAQCVSASVAITVNPHPPTANADTYTTAYLVAVASFNILANDAAVAPRALNASSVTLSNIPATGGAIVGSNGVYTFTPASGFSGAFAFDYQVCDDSDAPLCASSTVTITVGASQVPTVTNDAAATNENSAVTTNVLANDNANDGASLVQSTLTITSGPSLAGATATANADGSITYTPPNFVTGSDSITYQICDSKGLCSSGTYSITINPVPPIANADSASTGSNTPVNINVLSNDVLPLGAGSLGSVSISGPVTGGSAVVQADNSITFSPTAVFAGAASFQYQICDITKPNALCSTATVTVNVAATAPVAGDVSKTIQEGAAATSIVAVLSAGTGGAINLASLAIGTAAAHGTALANSDGTFTYTVAAGFYGSDSFTYRVCDNQATPLCSGFATVSITITPFGPTANPDSASTAYRTAVSIPVTSNDAQGARPFSISAVGATADGTTAINGNSIDFTPGASFYGAASFTYTICDDSATNSGSSPLCSSTTVSVTVVAPTAPTAINDAVTTGEEQAVDISVLSNDNSGSSAFGALSSTSAPAHGTLTLANNVFTYTPTGYYYGADSFTYQICNTEDLCASAQVDITVTPRGPTAVSDNANVQENSFVNILPLSNDIEGAVLKASWTLSIVSATGGSASLISATSIRFTPTANQYAAGQVVYQVCDISTPTPLCSSANIDISVTTVSPTNGDYNLNVNENAAATSVNVLSVAVAGSAALKQQVTILSGPSHGSAVANADGTISYTPNTGYYGADSLTFRTCDVSVPALCTVSNSLNIAVAPLGPTANADSVSTAFQTAVTYDVTLNDVQGAQPFASPAISLLNPPAGASVAADGKSITFVPATGFTGDVIIQYRLSDTSNPAALTSDSSLTVTVNGIGPQVTAILYRLVSLNYDLASGVIRASIQTRTPVSAKVNAIRLNSVNSSGLAPLSGAPVAGPACAASSPAGSCDQFHIVSFQSTPCSVSAAILALDADFTCADGRAASQCGYINFKSTYLLANMQVAYDACAQTTTFGVDTSASSLTLNQDAARTTPYAAGAAIQQLSTLFCRGTVAPSIGSVFSSVTMTNLAVVNAATQESAAANAIGQAYFAAVTDGLTSNNPAGNAIIDFDLLLEPTVFLESESYFLRATFSLQFRNTGAKRTIILPINGIKSLRSQSKGVRDVTAPAPTQQSGVNSKPWVIPRAASSTTEAGQVTGAPVSNNSASSPPIMGIAVGVAVGVAILAVVIIVIIVVVRKRRSDDSPHRNNSDAPLIINPPSTRDEFN